MDATPSNFQRRAMVSSTLPIDTMPQDGHQAGELAKASPSAEFIEKASGILSLCLY